MSGDLRYIRAYDAFIVAYLKDLMACSNGNFSRAARMSGLSKSHVYRLVQRYQTPFTRTIDSQRGINFRRPHDSADTPAG